ncbi:MAG: hypothetical protein ACRC41_17310 [Sarcina sp.]
MEECYEQFLSQDYGTKQEYLNGTAGGLLLVSGIGFFGLRNMFLAVGAIAAYGATKLYMKNKYVEYEYELICDELTISKIMNKRKRKKIANIELKNVMDVSSNANHKIKDVFIDEKGLTKKVIYVKEGNKITGYRVALDKKLLAKCTRINPRLFSDF